MEEARWGECRRRRWRVNGVRMVQWCRQLLGNIALWGEDDPGVDMGSGAFEIG